MNDNGIVTLMREHRAPMTREEYIAWNWSEGYTPTAEEEIDIPVEFRLWTSGGRFKDTGDYKPSNCSWQTWAQQRAEARKKQRLS